MSIIVPPEWDETNVSFACTVLASCKEKEKARAFIEEPPARAAIASKKTRLAANAQRVKRNHICEVLTEARTRPPFGSRGGRHTSPFTKRQCAKSAPRFIEEEVIATKINNKERTK